MGSFVRLLACCITIMALCSSLEQELGSIGYIGHNFVSPTLSAGSSGWRCWDMGYGGESEMNGCLTFPIPRFNVIILTGFNLGKRDFSAERVFTVHKSRAVCFYIFYSHRIIMITVRIKTELTHFNSVQKWIHSCMYNPSARAAERLEISAQLNPSPVGNVSQVQLKRNEKTPGLKLGQTVRDHKYE